MHAIDDLSDAIETSRRFLAALGVGSWVRLAVVVFFVSSLGVGLTFPGGDVATYLDGPAIDEPTSEALAELEAELPVEDLVAALLVAAAVALVLWLGYALVAAVMEFVFLEALRSGEVRIRSRFAANAGKGVRLFLFRLALTVVAGALVAGPAVLVADGGSFGELSAGLIGLYLLYGFGVYLLYSVVRRFTDEFVAAVMLGADCGVLAAWGRFWRTVRANAGEYAVYLVLAWILSIAVAVTVWVVVGLAAAAIAIPFAIAIFLLVLAGPIGWALAVPVGLLALALLLAVVALVWTPITTYFRYYALLLLGDTEPEFDLVAEQRAAVRAADSGGPLGDDWTRTDRDPSARGRRGDERDPWGTRDDGPEHRGEPDRRNETEGWDAPSNWDRTSDWDADSRDEGGDRGDDGSEDGDDRDTDDRDTDDRTW